MFQFSKLLQGSQRSLGDDGLVDRDQFAWPLCWFDHAMCLFVCPLCWLPLSRNVFVCKTNWIIYLCLLCLQLTFGSTVEEISSESNHNISTDQHSTCAIKERWCDHGEYAHLKGLETWHGWLISLNTQCFCFYTKLTDIPCIYTF